MFFLSMGASRAIAETEQGGSGGKARSVDRIRGDTAEGHNAATAHGGSSRAVWSFGIGF
ncbi:MAG: hypothetical protein GF344_17250 [Chitinivibrionales bacterium]|nr:hypothetical protein [Chitinivibrionales bacterium]